MTELKCPNCGKVFTVDEDDYTPRECSTVPEA